MPNLSSGTGSGGPGSRSGQTTINFTPAKRPRPEPQGEEDEDVVWTPKKRLREGGKLPRSPEAEAYRRAELRPAINRKGEHLAKRARGINVSKEDSELQESPRGGGELDLEWRIEDGRSSSPPLRKQPQNHLLTAHKTAFKPTQNTTQKPHKETRTLSPPPPHEKDLTTPLRNHRKPPDKPSTEET